MMPASATTPETPTVDQSTVSLTSSKTELDASSLYSQAQRSKSARSSTDILIFLIAFRILNAFCIRTFFQPDEYFQSLEPAWYIAFGSQSGAWLTWEWEHQLRSTLHPYIFAAGYWIADIGSKYLQLNHVTRAEILIAVPKIIQAHIAACGDYFTWKLGERVYGRRTLEAWACLALTVCSPWQWFCSTRTLSNCLETTITVIALNYWPWEWSLQAPDRDVMADSVRLRQDNQEVEPGQPLRLKTCLVLAATACILRPTNILIWALVTYFTLFRVTRYERVIPVNWTRVPVMITVSMPELLNATRRERSTLVKETIRCGAIVLIISALIDRSFYKEITFPPLKFLIFNLVKSLAVFYGRNDWHYYLSQGFPLLLTTFLPFAAIGIYEALTNRDEIDEDSDEQNRLTPAIRYQFASISLIVPFILSFISHKEVRFIYPILPLLHILCAPSAAGCIRPSLEDDIALLSHTPASSPPSSPTSSTIISNSRLHPPKHRTYGNLSAYRPSILPIILLLNLLIAMFTTQYHQRGVLSVMDFLRHEHETHYLTQPPAEAHLIPADTTMTVGFLMPCHSTPWRSHLVYSSIQAWALGCEPPIHTLPGPARDAYMDEADRFYADPLHFLRSEIKLRPLEPIDKRSIRTSKFLRSSPTDDRPGTIRYNGVPVETKHGLKTSRGPLSPWDGGLGIKHWPEYLVLFEESNEAVITVAGPMGYNPCWRGWNSWFHDDWRRRGDVLVLHRPPDGVEVKKKKHFW